MKSQFKSLASLLSGITVFVMMAPCLSAQTRDQSPTYSNTYSRASLSPYPSRDVWGFYNRQCTSYCAWKLNERQGRSASPWVFTNGSVVKNGVSYAGRWGHAYEWDDRARALGSVCTVNTTPQPGAIAHWDIGEGMRYRNARNQWEDYGHVAWVERVNADGSVDISEYNYRSNAFTTCRSLRNVPRFIHIFTEATPPAPSSLWVSSISSNAVSLGWLGAPGVSQYRVHISRASTGWTASRGWDAAERRNPTYDVPVNFGGSSASYTWSQGSSGNHSGPQAGVTYWYSVRQNTISGASSFSAPRSFTVPYPVGAPSMTLSTTSISRSVSQYTSPSASTFTIRNSGTGTLTYSATSSAGWMSVSPSNGTSTGESDTLNVNFSTSGYSPQTLTGRITITGGSAGTQTLSVTLSITGTPLVSADDHGNYLWSASPLARYGSLAGNLERGGDVDFFQVYISSYGYVSFYSTGSSTVDTYGYLYDSSGRQIAMDDDSNGNYHFRLGANLSPGYYYLMVRGFSSTTTGAYRVYAQ